MDSLSLTLLSLFLAYAHAEATTMSTSVVQATRHETHTYTSSVPASSGGYGSNAINTEGGASGTSAGSFNLSQGAMIAIIVVVVVVAVFGIASVVLFILAKRRQWNVRQTIKRASRRITGKSTPKDDAMRKKRSGIIAGSNSRSTRAAYPPGQKRAVVVEVKDEEKGLSEYPPPPKTKGAKQNGLADKLRGNHWK